MLLMSPGGVELTWPMPISGLAVLLAGVRYHLGSTRTPIVLRMPCAMSGTILTCFCYQVFGIRVREARTPHAEAAGGC